MGPEIGARFSFLRKTGVKALLTPSENSGFRQGSYKEVDRD